MEEINEFLKVRVGSLTQRSDHFEFGNLNRRVTFTAETPVTARQERVTAVSHWTPKTLPNNKWALIIDKSSQKEQIHVWTLQNVLSRNLGGLLGFLSLR